MDAGKATISGVFNGSRLLEIPFYQRAYVWGEEQWERFLGDMEFVTASKRPYFLGSIILKQESSGNTWSEVSEVRTVIDGQQRLTTMIIFFKALCAKIGAGKLFERDFILETGDVALSHGIYYRDDFKKVVDAKGSEPIDGSSAIIGAYNYFLKNIDSEQVDRNAIKSNVQFVCIDLTEGEDERQIFDTINSLGVRLTTAELLKNYFFNHENEQAFKGTPVPSARTRCLRRRSSASCSPCVWRMEREDARRGACSRPARDCNRATKDLRRGSHWR